LASPRLRSLDEIGERLAGQTVETIDRRGKFLRMGLRRDTLLFHLRMSGDLLVEPANLPPAAHHRFLLGFSDGLRLAFNDPRKFGRIWLTDQPEGVLSGLGPEPLDPGLDPGQFWALLQSRQRQLKPLLLDQGFLAGLGNIYTDEALNRAAIHPLRLSHSLSPVEAERLLAAIREVLEAGIERHGSSIDWVYRGGDFQNYFRVYGRKGQPCPRCGTPVARILVGQRSTHFCPNCQV
jgi:formamidopyrimidine-DNA glycosylase